jgi:hypothetical protein
MNVLETTSGNRAAATLPLLLLMAMIAWPGAAGSATPASGTLTPGTPTTGWTGNVAGANYDESTCMDGTTCDVYTLTLAPGDYTGKRISIDISWLLPTSDYDLYVHANTLGGPIVTQDGSAPPGTSESGTIPIDPPVVAAAKTYVVHVVAFAVPAGTTYNGQVSLVATPAPRTAIYLAGTLNFSPNVTLYAPVTVRDGEPSVRVDTKGNCYVGGIRGVPAGVDLWRFDLNPASPTFDPGMRAPTYLGQPDAFLPQDPDDPTTGGADGGGDIDIAVSFPAAPTDTPIVTIVSLAAAEISSAVSTNRGADFTLSPAVAIAPVDDRQWIEAYGPNTVYMLYRAPGVLTGLFGQRSDDNGLTYPFGGVISPSGSTPGYIDVDHASGAVYASHMGSTSLFVARSADGGLTWRNTTADNTTSHGNLFDPVKVGDDGTVYAVWSDLTNIYMVHSTDGGNTWSEKVRVNDNAVYKVNLMPWLEAGSAGRVVVCWYGTTSTVNDDSADWHVLFTQTMNATDNSPTFRQQVVSDHVIHGANISLGGLDPTGGANRNLIDYFQVALDPQGAAVIAFTDDHNDFDGNTFVTRQLDGPSLYANANGTGNVNPVTLPPLPPPSPAAPEVSDFLHDAVVGLLQPIPEDNPYDILWVDYSCEPGTGGDHLLVATIKLSDLAAVPSGTIWRAHFAPNSAGGVSDRGDQFYMEASTVGANPAFTFGTAVRDGDGGLTYTARGACQGVIDAAGDRIVLKVALGQLNPYVTHGPPVTIGSVIHGLRGSCFTTGANAIRDNTRGGTSFTFPNCGPVPVTLASFTVTAGNDGYRIDWRFTGDSEPVTVGIDRGTSAVGPWERIAPTITDEGGHQVATDAGVPAGVAPWYRLQATHRDGTVSLFGPVGTDGAAPAIGLIAEFVGGPRPNPARGATTVSFRVSQPGFVELSVFDPQGRRVRSILSGVLDTGNYERTWDGRTDRFNAAPAGMYLLVLHTADGVRSQRVVLAR